MRLILLAVAAAILQQPPQVAAPPLDIRITQVTSVPSDVRFENPLVRLKGVIAPTAGNRLQIVEIALGATPVFADLAAFRLVSGLGTEFIAIAVGARADLLLPVARFPLDQEVGQILPSDAIVAMTRHGELTVTIEAGPLATLAFLYDIPVDAVVKSLRLPDGSLLPLR